MSDRHNPTSRIKSALRQVGPLRALRHAVLRRQLLGKSRGVVFQEIYAQNKWGSEESASGTGSTLAETEAIRAALPGLLTRYQIGSVLDLPCGDFHWMSRLDLPVRYLGGDLVPELIERNRKVHPAPNRAFEVLDLLEGELPPFDLLFCRDCLVHLSFRDIQQAVKNIQRSEITWLLTTSFPNEPANVDIATGMWRRLNLEAAPFHFPPPAEVVEEQSQTPGGEGKAMLLWRVADLPA